MAVITPLLVSFALATAPPHPVRALVVTGGHSYDASFFSLFEGYDGLVWEHRASPEEAFGQSFRDEFDLVVFYDMSDSLSHAARMNLRSFVEGGGGVLAIHHAILNYPDWSWWHEEVVGGLYLEKAREDRPASSYRHDEEMTLIPVSDHPVLAGVDTIRVEDETYLDVWQSDGITPLLATDNPTSDRVVAWVGPYEDARVVYIQPGHGPGIYHEPGYRQLLYNAIQWCAGRGPSGS